MKGPYSLSNAAVAEAAATWGVTADVARVRIERQNAAIQARTKAVLAAAAKGAAELGLGPHNVYPSRVEFGPIGRGGVVLTHKEVLNRWG